MLYLFTLVALLDCRSPPPTIGIFHYSTTTAGSVASLTCNLPYVVQGNPDYICSSVVGTWKGDGRCSKQS